MKETATSCSISCKKKLQLFSIIAILLVTAVVWSNQTKTVNDNELVVEEAEKLVPFSNGPTGPPGESNLPTEMPPS